MLILLFVFFMIIAKLIPPMSPTMSAEDVATFLIEDKWRIRIGVVITMLAASVFIPFLGVICVRLYRLEGRLGVLTATQLLASSFFVPGIWVALMSFATALFRPESRAPEITRAFSDFFWLMFIGIAGVAVTQALVLAVASFIDRGATPTFPRWYGYFNLWYATLSVPGNFVVVFNDGPLAWNGAFAFWIPLTVFTIWLIVTIVVLLRAIGRDEKAEAV